MEQENYYNNQIIRHIKINKKLHTYRNLITFFKLSTAAFLLLQLYWFTQYVPVSPLYPILSVIFFIVLNKIDSHIIKQSAITKKTIENCKTEIEYLHGNLSHLDTGIEFLQAQHDYAADLDIFGENSLFQHINRTVTHSGKDQLVQWLLKPCQDAETIMERQEAARELSTLPEWCQHFRAYGERTDKGTKTNDTLALWLNKPSFFKHPKRTRITLYFINLISIISWIATIFSLIPLSVAGLFFFIQLFILTTRLKKINEYHSHLNLFLKDISNIHPLIKTISKQDFQSKELLRIKQNLFPQGNNTLTALKELQDLQETLDQRGNILVTFLLDGLYIKDFHSMLKLDKWKMSYANNVSIWIQSISEIDALTSMGIYSFNHPEYCYPTISKNEPINMTAVGHPLIKYNECVTNDFKVDHRHRIYIVTGANMAGKSTFLRTIGLNLVLAHAGCATCCKSFSFKPMLLFTSMRTTDNLSKNTSYFHAELLRLKQLIEIAKTKQDMFIILDEMLKGTNSADKLNGSLKFLRKLQEYSIAGLVATHDLELGKLEHEQPDNFSNLCFEITHSGENIWYDYKLHTGITHTMNATILLKQMGLI